VAEITILDINVKATHQVKRMAKYEVAKTILDKFTPEMIEEYRDRIEKERNIK
jgi:hypothetical protein